MSTKKHKIYVAIPTTGTVVDSQSYVLRELQENYKEHVELYFPAQAVRRIFHDFARNKLVEDFLATDCDILWFLDSDIAPSREVLDLVAVDGDKWQLAGACYPVFMTPPGGEIPEVVFTTYKKNPETGNFTPSNAPKEGKEFVDGLATGCLFIKREVLEKLEKPYFEFTFDKLDRELKEGEDLGFCRKVHELGYKFYVDYSLVCRHQKTVDLFDVNNYAIQFSNRNVQAYDALIKQQVRDAIKAAYQQGMIDAAKKEKAPEIVTPGSAHWNKFSGNR